MDTFLESQIHRGEGDLEPHSIPHTLTTWVAGISREGTSSVLIILNPQQVA